MVVSRDTATQPFGIVVLGTDGRLARIDRTLWVAAAAETNGIVCGPGVESGPVPRRCLGPCKSRRRRLSLSQLLHAYYRELTPPDPQSYVWLGTASRETRPSMRVVVGLCWARVGTILGLPWAILGLGHSGPRWHQNGDMLGHFRGTFCGCVGLCKARVGPTLSLSWAILGHVGTYWAHVGPSWAILGSVLAFVLDLDIPVSLKFRPRKAFAKNIINTKNKHNFGLRFGCFCFFLVACCT